MLRFVLIKNNKDTVTYEYFPEGKTQSGFISISKATGELNVEKIADSDKFKRYAAKMFRKLKEFQKANFYEEKGIIAWY